MSRLPDSYRVQNGCRDCRHCARICEYDDGNTYYCAYGAPERPPCGSVAMEESFSERGVEPLLEREDRELARIEAWAEWSEGREVAAWGTCGHWEHDKERIT